MLIVTKGEMNCTRKTLAVSRRPKPRTMETPIGLAPITGSPGKDPVLKVKLRRRIEGPGKTAKHELAQDPGSGEDNPAVS